MAEGGQTPAVSLRLWRVRRTFLLPRLVTGETPEGGGLPEQLSPAPRALTGRATINDVEVRMAPVTYDFIPSGEADAGEISFLVEAMDAEAALAVADPILDAVVESFRFQLQLMIGIVMLHILDVTPPVEVGDTRGGFLFPFPLGYPLQRFRSSVQLGGVETAIEPDLGLALKTESPRAQASLTWFLKALAAPFDVDRFMLLWVATEILSKDAEAVTAPYTAPCGHSIPTCPECDCPTDRPVLGATIQQFLIQRCDVSADDARHLWRLRQIFHGDVPFDSSAMDDLPRLVQILYAACARLLKHAFRLADSDLPRVTAGNPAILPQVRLGFETAVEAADLS